MPPGNMPKTPDLFLRLGEKLHNKFTLTLLTTWSFITIIDHKVYNGGLI